MKPIAGILLAGLLAAACSGPTPIDGAVPVPPSDAPADVSTEMRQGGDPLARLVAAPCDGDFDPTGALRADDDDTDVDAECGYMVVDEDREGVGSQQLEIAYVRVPAPDSDDQPLAGLRPPLLIMVDGPGASAIDELPGLVDSPLRAGRDLVLMDVRGTGRSFPVLDCGETTRPGSVPPDLITDCHQSLVDDGIRLSAYDAAAMAADAEDLRRALRIDRWSILAVGHGARVALRLIGDADSSVASAVLDSPLPPDVDLLAEQPLVAQTSLNRLFDACTLDDECRATFGDLRLEVERMIERFNRSPAEGEGGTDITGDDLALAARASMRGRDGPSRVPAALAVAVDGDAQGALAALLEVRGERSDFSEGVLLSSRCAEDADPRAIPDADATGLGAVGRAVAVEARQLLAACGVWGVPAGEDAAVPDGEVPVLVLVGEFNPFAAPAWGGRIAAVRERGQVVQVDGAGHRVWDADDCTVGIVAAFLRSPRLAVDAGCAGGRTIDFNLG